MCSWMTLQNTGTFAVVNLHLVDDTTEYRNIWCGKPTSCCSHSDSGLCVTRCVHLECQFTCFSLGNSVSVTCRHKQFM